MDSTFVPVETILKVSEDEMIEEENQELEETGLISSNCVSIGTQCDWKLEQPDSKTYESLLPDAERPEEELSALNSDTLLISDKNYSDASMVIRGWSLHSEPTDPPDQKILIPASLSQQYGTSNVPTSLEEENYMLKLDYKSRNKMKTKQRRMDPLYRSQERVKQRTVMRMKRQDPVFRATEREKGRYRMRLKRLDPEFRSEERKRQRERMKAKRSDPEFREREREQQKNRLHVKRLDPAFKEKERVQDKIRMLMKRQNSCFFPNIDSDAIKMCPGNENVSLVSDMILKNICKSSDPSRDFQNRQAVFPENFSSKLLSLKSRESIIDSFNFKKQHILNFNYFNPNKEQWTQEMCSKTLMQVDDDQESDISQTSSLTDVNSDFMKKSSANSKIADAKAKEVSQPLIIMKPNELPFTEAQKPHSLSHRTVSPNKFLSSPDLGN